MTTKRKGAKAPMKTKRPARRTWRVEGVEKTPAGERVHVPFPQATWRLFKKVAELSGQPLSAVLATLLALPAATVMLEEGESND